MRYETRRAARWAVGMFALAGVVPAGAVLGQYTVRGVPVIRWGQTNGSVGLSGPSVVVEDFEDVTLAPGLRVRWSAPGGVVGPVSVLPALFRPATDDPAGTAFNLGVWDGVRCLVSSRGNVVTSYAAASGNWGDVGFEFDPPVAAVGFSLENMDSAASLVVNGVNIGQVPSLSGLSAGSGRQGYVVITSTAGATITSVLLDNSGGDGFAIDRLLYTTVPAPVVTVAGLDATVWPRPDNTLGLSIEEVEEFEDVNLTPGLQVGWDTPAVGGQVAPSGVLPNTFAPVSQDVFGDAFDSGPWTGTRAVINTRTNQTFAYTGTQEWGDIVFRFDPPRQAVGFSIQQAESPVRLLVNGRDVGSLLERAGLAQGSGRHGYVRVEAACDGEPMWEIRLNNGRQAIGGDGFTIDHMILGTTARVVEQPVSRSVCLGGPAALTAVAGGTPPFLYSWLWREVGGASFEPVVLGPNAAPGGGAVRFVAQGPDASQLGFIVVSAGPALEFRCAVATQCGSAFSQVAVVSVGCPNPADIAQADGSPGCDGTVNNGDFQLFFGAFFGAVCPECGGAATVRCNEADIASSDASVGFDGCVDNGDFQLFFGSFFTPCP